MLPHKYNIQRLQKLGTIEAVQKETEKSFTNIISFDKNISMKLKKKKNLAKYNINIPIKVNQNTF